MERLAADCSKGATNELKDLKKDENLSNALREKMTCMVENQHKCSQIFQAGDENSIIPEDRLLEEYACFKTDDEEDSSSRLEHFVENSFSDQSEGGESDVIVESDVIEDVNSRDEMKAELPFSIFTFMQEDNSSENSLTNDSTKILGAKDGMSESKVENNILDEEIFDSIVGKSKNFLSAIVEEEIYAETEDSIYESNIDNEYEKLLDRLKPERSKSIGSITLNHNNLETTIKNSHSSLNLESLSRRNSEPAGLFSESEVKSYQITNKNGSNNSEDNAEFCESLDIDDYNLPEVKIERKESVSESVSESFTEENTDNKTSKNIMYTSSDYENNSESDANTQIVYMERPIGCLERFINRIRAIFNL